jgi:hypothetical protein
MTPAEARRQALLRFGGLERVKESTRDEIRPALLEDSVRDVRHGVRVLRRAPGFTVAALVTPALGIGAIFSVVRTVMLEPLPYHEPDRIVALWEITPSGRGDVLDMTLTADGRRLTVIGVMPPGFTVVGQKAEFLVPFGLDAGSASRGARPR